MEETNVKLKSTPTPPEASTSQPACRPPFLYNQPAFSWSPFIQLPNGSQNVSSEQENDVLANCPGIALCVYPCAWIMPPTDHDDPLHLWPSNDPNPFTKTTENRDHPHLLSMRLDSVTCKKMAKEDGGQNIGFGTEEVVPMPSQRDKASDCSASVNGKRISEATAAAAEARKKRKQLIKFKNQHYKRE